MGVVSTRFSQARRQAALQVFAPAIVSLVTLLSGAAQAHGFSAGDVSVEHPYALPTPPGARTGAVYFRAIRNGARQPDRLVGASTPVADRVELHESAVDGAGVMRMREITALELPPRKALRLRHGGGFHLMLIGLRSPLEIGERFPLRLTFERGGETEVMVWIQQPKGDRVDEHRH